MLMGIQGDNVFPKNQTLSVFPVLPYYVGMQWSGHFVVLVLGSDSEAVNLQLHS